MHLVTDAELQAYRDNNGIGGTFNSVINAAGNRLKDNWGYVAGGILMATGVGGPIGLMLISAGADTIIQKATTGSVDWGEVAVSGVLGVLGVLGGIGATGAIFGSLGGAVAHGAGTVASRLLGDAAPTSVVSYTHSSGDAGPLVPYDPKAASRTLVRLAMAMP